MNKFGLKYNIKRKPEDAAIKLNIIQNGRFATLLFIIGCFLNFIEYDTSEKAIFQTLCNTADNNLAFNNEVKAARIAEVVSIIFFIAMSIYANNAVATLKLQINEASSKRRVSNTANNEGFKFIAFFDLIKVMAYAGAAVGYYIALQELEESKNQ